MTLALTILVVAILAEHFNTKPECNCPGKCKLHKNILGHPHD